MPEENGGAVTSLAGLVFDRLEEEIVSGVLQSGTVLTESELSARYGVSRTPVREALRRLEQEQLIVEKGKGIQIRGITVENVREIFEIRKVLETEAVRLCTARIRPEVLTELRQVVELQRVYAEFGGKEKLHSSDSEFHRAIYENCGNATMGDILAVLHRKLSRYRQMSAETDDRSGKMYTEHLAIWQAMADGDGDRAAALTLQHIENAEAHILG